MVRPYVLTIPETAGQMLDMLGTMQLTSPYFTHDIFPGKNIDTEFTELFAGLENIRGKVGDECYERLTVMAAEMRARFEANEVRAGNIIAYEMQEAIKEAGRLRRRKGAANDKT